jgi:hypothetical protein
MAPFWVGGVNGPGKHFPGNEAHRKAQDSIRVASFLHISISLNRHLAVTLGSYVYRFDIEMSLKRYGNDGKAIWKNAGKILVIRVAGRKNG